MDRNNLIQNALNTGKVDVDFQTGEIFSTRIRGHEGERIRLEGSLCSGYIVHTLAYKGEKKQCRAHQIIWIASHGVYDKEALQIDHINRNRQDNRLCNLRLVTQKENLSNTEHKDRRKLKDEARHDIFLLYQRGEAVREIAKKYKVSKSLVSLIVKEAKATTLPFLRQDGAPSPSKPTATR